MKPQFTSFPTVIRLGFRLPEIFSLEGFQIHVAVFVVATLFRMEASAAESDGVAFFESRVRPVLVMHCYECHSSDQSKGGLRLDYRGGFEKGGDSGALVDPSEPEKSLLLQAIRHEKEDLKMPKGADPLSDGVIADFSRWVGMGLPGLPEHPPTAKDAATEGWQAKLANRRSHWAWQPVQKATVPDSAEPGASPHPVDRFLLEMMREKGLEPAAAAPPEAVLRRLKFALVGLPPTEEERVAFVRETAAVPSEKDPMDVFVDRFLESPQFGEHWAAYWLDLMRFGETGGYVRDYPIPQAWRYRDYVIRAFNADVPYDRFVEEHVAGDLLPPRLNAALQINEAPLGTGFMRLM